MKGYFELSVNDTVNVSLMQHENIETVIQKLAWAAPVENIIEIGTNHGGFTYVLSKYFGNANIYTFDPHSHAGVDELAELCGFDYRKEGIGPETGVPDDVIDIIQREGRTIVFCDGGNKIEEFKLLAPHIKRGDIIMAHDYSHSRIYFQEQIKGKIWDWCEITAEPLGETLKTYSLSPYMKDEFQSVVWGCFIKDE